VHGENLVVPGRPKQSIIGRRQLEPHQKCFDTSQQQEHKSGHDVPFADLLMSGDRKPPKESGFVPPHPI
jgi:hypothetical protein